MSTWSIPAILCLWEYHVSRKSIRSVDDFNVIEIHVVILLILFELASEKRPAL